MCASRWLSINGSEPANIRRCKDGSRSRRVAGVSGSLLRIRASSQKTCTRFITTETPARPTNPQESGGSSTSAPSATLLNAIADEMPDGYSICSNALNTALMPSAMAAKSKASAKQPIASPSSRVSPPHTPYAHITAARMGKDASHSQPRSAVTLSK